jgi:hypothetical protein
MSVPAKLAGFAAVLALVFTGAAFAGSRLDVRPGEPAAERAAGSAMGGMAAEGEGEGEGHGGDRMAPQAVRGLAVSDKGLALELARTTAEPGRPFALAFRVADRRGRTVRGFDVEHTKRMHLIVVRRDMTGFQHLHPTQGPDGRWSVPVTLREPGVYRVLADFSVDGTPATLAGEITVDGALRTQPLPAPVRAVDVDGLRVALGGTSPVAGREADLRFTVTRAGKPVRLRNHLGAKGHLVALREGDLAFLHVHPDEDRLQFGATFPTAGRYRLFLQFKTEDGRLHTAAFTREAVR